MPKEQQEKLSMGLKERWQKGKFGTVAIDLLRDKSGHVFLAFLLLLQPFRSKRHLKRQPLQTANKLFVSVLLECAFV